MFEGLPIIMMQLKKKTNHSEKKIKIDPRDDPFFWHWLLMS